jgi:hypothetical protein
VTCAQVATVNEAARAAAAVEARERDDKLQQRLAQEREFARVAPLLHAPPVSVHARANAHIDADACFVLTSWLEQWARDPLVGTQPPLAALLCEHDGVRADVPLYARRVTRVGYDALRACSVRANTLAVAPAELRAITLRPTPPAASDACDICCARAVEVCARVCVPLP